MPANGPEVVADTSVRHLHRQWGDLPRKALEALALEAYRDGHFSARQVGELLGLDFWRAEAFLREHWAYLEYDEEDLARDEAALDGLPAQRK